MGNFSSINLYFQDESRFGLFTRNGRALTARGIKPICKFQQVFKSTYLFGCFSPITGDNFVMEISHCNAKTFQIFLDEFSKENTNELKIVVLDNAAFHKAKSLKIPNNIILIYQPPYTPEVNPAENIWEQLKRDFTGKLFKTLDNLSSYLQNLIKGIEKSQVKQTCSFEYIYLNSFWTKL